MSVEFDKFVNEVNAAPPLRKMSALIDRTNLPADVKAILMDVANLTITVGGRIIALGRRLLAFALDLIKAFPGMAMGAVMALVLAAVIDSIPGIGNKYLMAILTPLLLAVGMGIGALQDLTSPDFRSRVSAVADSFKVLVGV